ncbi:hypothetical protein PITC_069610 [Penicillium italicum]|uniref:Uncharacterized protein n=1 Tax=Penicillium italicum TaxID=40296 RepID=A0A0A2KW35_PENIT|nr:hypothetical protein PITC_069610 [Penicillium italicum]
MLLYHPFLTVLALLAVSTGVLSRTKRRPWL